MRRESEELCPAAIVSDLPLALSPSSLQTLIAQGNGPSPIVLPVSGPNVLAGGTGLIKTVKSPEHLSSRVSGHLILGRGHLNAVRWLSSPCRTGCQRAPALLKAPSRLTGPPVLRRSWGLDTLSFPVVPSVEVHVVGGRLSGFWPLCFLIGDAGLVLPSVRGEDGVLTARGRRRSMKETGSGEKHEW